MKMLVGDLNEIVDESKKFGGRPILGKRLFLNNLIKNLVGIDLGFMGIRYTWDNGHEWV